MKRLTSLFALTALSVPSLATAQMYPKPPDVPDYVPIPATYAAGTTLNVLGDGSDVRGGTAPYMANQLRDIPSPPNSNLTYNPGSDACVSGTAGCNEQKMRTQVGFSHISFDDSIRNYSQPGTSHCHTFWGNKHTNAWSTYGSLRTNGESVSAGSNFNASAYWAPCIIVPNAFGDGKDRVVLPTNIILYYQDAYGVNDLSLIPRGLRYVMGINMDDPDGLKPAAERDAANAQPGTAGRYGKINNGVIGWKCNGNLSARTLVKADGTDGFDGQCQAGMQLTMEIIGPTCWDGHNPWAPGGYDNMRGTIYDNVAKDYVCPNHWYKLPSLSIKPIYMHNGPTDYMRWTLSSDAGAAAKAGHSYPPTWSMHSDWMGGWDGETFKRWQYYCNAIPLPGKPAPIAHECDGSQMDKTLSLNYGLVPYLPSGTSDPTNMALVPPQRTGGIMIHAH